MNKKPITKEEATRRLENLCSRSEQCEFELSRKLITWGINAGDRRSILDYLKENRYVDEERYARSYTNDKARFSGWGPLKIRMELVKRRINSKMIQAALDQVEEKIWKESLLRNTIKKAKELDLTGENSRENKQKLLRFLIGRGFPTNLSIKAVNYITKKQSESEESDE